MVGTSIRAAYPSWPGQQRSLRDVVAGMRRADLAIVPGPDRWPLWATIGHLACQRVFWLCDFAGEPGAVASPFPNAAFDCPGDDDLEHEWGGPQLVDALDRTFAIVERCLDTWTMESLAEVIDHPEWGEDWARTRGGVIQRVFAHDISHITELNDSFAAVGLPAIELWD
jgi:hypothetical protein